MFVSEQNACVFACKTSLFVQASSVEPILAVRGRHTGSHLGLVLGLELHPGDRATQCVHVCVFVFCGLCGDTRERYALDLIC